MKELIVVFFILLASSCSYKKYCTTDDFAEYEYMQIRKMKIKPESILVEIVNLGDNFIYLPGRMFFDCNEEGICLLDNDIFATSVSIPVEI
ncbi:MAG: hypothetical protein AAFY36_05145, partial [Bacteroidota bacterium]